jgi:hypothetical protein
MVVGVAVGDAETGRADRDDRNRERQIRLLATSLYSM